VFPSQRDSHLYITPVTTLQYVKEHPEIIDGVRLGDRIDHSGIQGGIGLWSIITTLFLRLDPIDRVGHFLVVRCWQAGGLAACAPRARPR